MIGLKIWQLKINVPIFRLANDGFDILGRLKTKPVNQHITKSAHQQIIPSANQHIIPSAHHPIIPSAHHPISTSAHHPIIPSANQQISKSAHQLNPNFSLTFFKTGLAIFLAFSAPAFNFSSSTASFSM